MCAQPPQEDSQLPCHRHDCLLRQSGAPKDAPIERLRRGISLFPHPGRLDEETEFCVAPRGIRDPSTSSRGLIWPMARRDGRPEDAGEGKHPPQILYRARLSADFAIVFPLLIVAAAIETALLLKLG